VGYLGLVLVPPLVGYIAQLFGLRWSFAVISVFGAAIIYLVSQLSDNHEHTEPVITID
jgi:predicted MFS family arabinose efflux permease